MTAVANWPSELPQRPRRVGFAASGESSVIRTSMDVGPAKQRRRSTAKVRPFTIQLVLDDDERAIFEVFFEDVLADGCLSFSWMNPLTKVPAECRFRGEPSWSKPDGLWVADCELEVLP